MLKGAYVAIQETAPLTLILLATGSEVQHAVAAAKTLGEGVRVVSMPSMEIFDRQPAEYRDSILPPSVRKRISIEAGVTGLWHKYVGPEGRVIGIDRFGLSAPVPGGDDGSSGSRPDAVVAAAKTLAGPPLKRARIVVATLAVALPDSAREVAAGHLYTSSFADAVRQLDADQSGIGPENIHVKCDSQTCPF